MEKKGKAGNGGKQGTHGGNRGGDQHAGEKSKRSSPAAGRDPQRGKGKG